MNVYNPGAGADRPQRRKFDVNRKALSFYPFVASSKEISLQSEFMHFLMILYINIAPRQGAYSPQGHTAPRGQSFDVNRNFLSLRSSVVSFKSQTTIVSEKSIVLPFSHTKA